MMGQSHGQANAAPALARHWRLTLEGWATMPADNQLSITEHTPAHPLPGGPVIVLVHGSLDRASSFARVTRRLDDVHTVTYDRRGYHRSRHVVPVHTTVDGHIDDLVAIVDGRPAVVVGHSFGGTVALGTALRSGGPGSILAVAAYEPPLPWLGPWAVRARPHSGVTQWPTDDPGVVAEQFFRRMVGDSSWDRLPEETKAARRADGVALAAEIAAIRPADAPFDVPALTVPAVFGRGSASLPHQRQSVAWLAEHVPGADLVEIEGAAHGAHLTHPDAFAGFVRAAIARAAPPHDARYAASDR